MTDTADLKGFPESELRKHIKNPDPGTKGYGFAHTSLRIKEVPRSLEFYTGVLGMRLLHKIDFPCLQVTSYFLCHSDDDAPQNNKTQWTFTRKSVLELLHYWGKEDDPDFKYHNGNEEPKGFGHLGIVVPDLDEAVERFQKNGVYFCKKPLDGKLKGVAFCEDPDGYLLEIFTPHDWQKMHIW